MSGVCPGSDCQATALPALCVESVLCPFEPPCAFEQHHRAPAAAPRIPHNSYRRPQTSSTNTPFANLCAHSVLHPARRTAWPTAIVSATCRRGAWAGVCELPASETDCASTGARSQAISCPDITDFIDFCLSFTSARLAAETRPVPSTAAVECANVAMWSSQPC